MSSAIEKRLYVTALHNHFIRSQPCVLFMHVEATSDETTLGEAIRKILDSIKAVRLAHPVTPAAKEVPSRLDTARLEEIIEPKANLRMVSSSSRLGGQTSLSNAVGAVA